jgi:hypothetical protein
LDIDRYHKYKVLISKETMADENEQLAQEMNNFRNAAQTGGESLRDLGQGANNAATGVKAFGKATFSGAEAMAKGISQFSQAVGKGDTSFTAMNSVIDITSNALAGMAKAIPFAGEALAAGVKAAGEASKFVIDQLQTVTKTFQDFSDAGALTSKGMTGVADQFLASGMTMEGFKKSVKENAVALAQMGGTVGAGADMYTAAVGKLTKSNDGAGMALRNLGFSADAIGDAAAGFVKQQAMMGRQQKLDQASITQGTVEYARELDQLSKLTGMSRKEAQQAQEVALSESRFLAQSMHMESEGRVKEAKQMNNFQAMFAKTAPDVSKGLRDMVSGALDTAESQQVMRATNGEAAVIMEKVKNNQIDAAQAAKELGMSMEKNKGAMIEHMRTVGDATGALPKMTSVVAVTAMANEKNVEAIDGVKAAQKEQEKGSDELTNSTVKAQRALEGLSQEMFSLGLKALPFAANAVGTFSKSLQDFVAWVNKTIGGGGADSKKPPPTKEQAKASVAMTATRAESDSADKKLMDQMDATDSLRKSLAAISKTNDKSAENTAKIAALKKQIADSEQQELILNKEAKLASTKKLEAAAAQTSANRAARGQASTSTATPTAPAAGKAASAPAAPTAPAGSGTPAAPAASSGTGAAAPKSSSGGETGVETAGAQSIKIDDVLKFTARSGSRENFEQLDAGFKNLVLAAASDYKAVAGQPITINSAKRDSADQQRLYDAWIAGGKQGKPVATPGKSRHEKGIAVDIQNYADQRAVAAFNKQGLFQKIPNDPVHFQAEFGGIVPKQPKGALVQAAEAGLDEAFVPLPNSRKIPVEMPGAAEEKAKQSDLMAMIVSRLEELIEVGKHGNKTSKDILQVSRA